MPPPTRTSARACASASASIPGPALRDEGELYGRNVNLAARIADSAAGGEILVSETVSRRVGDGRWRLDEGRELELRGVSGRQRVYAVLWVPSATADQDDAGR